MKEKALEELAKYEKALEECWTERCASLAEGMVAGFCVIGLLTKEEGNTWNNRFYKSRRKFFGEEREWMNPWSPSSHP